jgi:predicted ATPase
MPLVVTLLYLGEIASARTHLEQGIALYDPQQHRSHAFRSGQDSGVACLAHASLALWMLGYPDQALMKNHQALTLAQELSHPFSLAWAQCFDAWCYQHRREEQTVLKQAEMVIAFSSEQGFAIWRAMGTILQGWALAAQGRQGDGLGQIRQGLVAFQATGAEMLRPSWLALLAEVYGSGEQIEEGLTVLAEALALVGKNGERWYEAELYRLTGQLRLRQAAPDEHQAEVCFHQALDIARRQQAKSWELRAAMSLARLWQQQGKQVEARWLLAPIYGWFTEGFDTADLQEAKALLAALS